MLIPPNQATINLRELEKTCGPIPPNLLYIQGEEVLLTQELREHISLTNQEGQHLWTIDMRTLAHPIASKLDNGDSMDPYSQMKNLWDLRLSSLPTEVERFLTRGTPNPRIKVLLVDDCPSPLEIKDSEGNRKNGYWRHQFFPGYKAGRRPKPKSWDSCTKAAYQSAQDLGIPILRYPYFEADDIFGSLVRHLPGYPHILSLGMLTVDTDLLQLVSDYGMEPPVYWYNLLKYEPRFRDYQGTLDYWEKRHKQKLLNPREIVDMKVKYGDKSDALPAGADRGLIDLLDPKIPLEEIPGIYGTQNSFLLSQWKTKAQDAQIRVMLDGNWDNY
jgi:hypothetical protein